MEMTKDTREKFIKTLYEKCSAGEISLDQREILIHKVNSMCVIPEIVQTESVEVENTETETTEPEVIETDVVESVEEETIETESVEAIKEPKPEVSAYEKYQLFKEQAYKKWNAGELTIEQREEILVKARDHYLQ